VAFAPDYARNQTIFAATAGGIYGSTDAARTWSYLGLGDRGADFEFGVAFADLALAPNYATEPVIIAAGNGNTFRSTDGGATWAIVGQSLSLQHIVFSPQFATDRTIFAAGTYGNGIYRSSNGGTSWQSINSGLSSNGRMVSTLAISPNYAADRTLFATTGGDGVYRSTDSGLSWSGVSQGLPDRYMASLVISPGYAADRTLFASSSSGVYRSMDGGGTWVRLNTDSGYNPAVYMDISPNFVADATIFATDLEGGVSRSQDGGVTWQRIRTISLGDIFSGTGMVYLSPNFGDDQTVFATTNAAGNYRSAISRNAGVSWEELGTGLAGTAVNAIAAFVGNTNQEVLLVGTDDGLYRSADSGKLWQRVLGSFILGIQAISASPNVAVDQTIFAGGVGLYRSNDGGRQWSTVESFPVLQTASPASFVGTVVSGIALSPVYPVDRTIFAVANSPGSNGTILRSTDDGLNWTAINSGLPTAADSISALAVSPTFANDKTLLVGVWGQGIYRSTNSGTNWVRVHSFPAGFVDGSVQALAFSPTFANDRTAFAVLGGQLLRSTDAGLTWANVASGPSGANVIAFSPRYASDRTIYLGTAGLVVPTGQIYQSTDGGQRWTPYVPELNRGRIGALSVSPIGLRPFVGTASGLYTPSNPVEIAGFFVDSYRERGQCYDVLVMLRNNTEVPITRRIDITEQVTYLNGRDEQAPLPRGRQDRFIDCDTGTELDMKSTITRNLSIPANSTATLRLRLSHNWDWIERQTITSAVFDLVSKEVLSAVLSIGFGSLGEAINAFGNLKDLTETLAGVSSARPSAHYAYALSIEGLVPPAAKTVEVRVNELQIGFYRGSLAASIEAMGLCPFAYLPWITPGCIFATATSKALYLSAYGEVSLTAMPTQSNTYRELAIPQPITLAALDVLTDRDQRTYVERQIAIDALRRAAVESLRRAALAEAADDKTWNLRQRQHARKLLEAAAARLGEVRRSAEALVTDMAAPTPMEIAAYQAALANAGFDETTQSVFADIGIATVEQEALKSYLLALTAEDWPDPSVIPAVHELQQREMLRLARTVAPTIYLPMVRR
jgi:photosystem II stability/assembly factor-like uncharacterized protein